MEFPIPVSILSYAFEFGLILKRDFPEGVLI
jgi:hypothetical protein